MTKSIISSFPCCPLKATEWGSLVSEWLPEFHTYPLNHIFWRGAYSTHLLEVSHFQHYILILVSGAHKEKLRLAVVDHGDCKLLIHRARTSSSAKTFILSHFISFRNDIQNTFLPIWTFVPSALCSLSSYNFSNKLFQYGVSMCPCSTWKAQKY